MSKKDKYTNEDYLAAILPCPECQSEYCFEDGNETESAIMCSDCGFEIVTNNIAKTKKKWNKIKRDKS